MGFFGLGKSATQDPTIGLPLDFLHKHQCHACPLDKLKASLKHPHMKPHGTDTPIIYSLGEAPGAVEDRRGIPFVGRSGNCLRFRIPDEWLEHIRWNNCVRTRPPGNRTPSQAEIECCRPSIIKDIENTKPQAIFGFGNIPLSWTINRTGITNWAGRKIPVQIGTHKCWFFPMMHPSYILRDLKRPSWFEPKRQTDYGSDLEFVFALHLRRAFEQVQNGLPEPVIHTQADAKRDVEIELTNVNVVLNFLEKLYDCKYVGLDYETHGTRPYIEDAKLLSIALSAKIGTLAFALEHPQAQWTETEKTILRNAYRQFILKAPCRKIVHNLIFEQEWTAYKFGKETLHAQPWECTFAQAYILDEKQRGTKDLDFLCLLYFGFSLKAMSNINRTNLIDEPIKDVLLYNGMDSKYHRLLFKAQNTEIANQGLEDVYKHQLRRIPTMALTQLKGIPVNQNRVAELEKEFSKRLTNIEVGIALLPEVHKFNKSTGYDFRPSANDDVHHILRRLGFETENVNEAALEKVDHPIAKLVLEYRGIAKQLSTYIKPLKTGAKYLYPDGMLHPTLNPGKVETWRTSSDSPNSQNWSRHEFREVRSSIRGDETEQVVSFDYAGIQARNVAMESRDAALVDAFWNDYDIHSDWMLRILKLYPRWIDGGIKAIDADKDLRKHWRNRAKNGFVFPSFFGAQPKKVSAELEVPENIGQKLHEQFWHKFPDILAWHRRLKHDYYKTGYVTGLSGFRRRAPISLNQRINSPIQSDEALIVCTAMAELSERGELKFQANIEVHDDLTFVWKKKEIDRNAEVVAKAMTKLNFPWLNVPIVVEMSVGDDWASTREVAKFSSTKLWKHKRGTV